MLNALTIDLEDYYHVAAFNGVVRRRDWDRHAPRVEQSTRLILDLLAEADIRATFFVLGWVANRYPRLIRSLIAAGHEVGCHSYWHQFVYRQTPEDFRRDVRVAKRVLEDVTGQAVRAFRAPSFSITARSLWALDVLIGEGFSVDSSIFPARHDRYGICDSPTQSYAVLRPNGEILEFPLSVLPSPLGPLPVCGGGYFRILPYTLSRLGLSGVNRDRRPFIFYLHPWEFDEGQPRFVVSFVQTRRHYFNLERTRERFIKLLGDFRFSSNTLDAQLQGV